MPASNAEEKKQSNLTIQKNTPFPSEGNETAQANFIEALLACDDFFQKENINNQPEANLKAFYIRLKSKEEIEKQKANPKYYSLFNIVKYKHIVQRYERPFLQLSTEEQQDFMCDLLFRNDDISEVNKCTILDAQYKNGIENIVAIHELLEKMNRIKFFGNSFFYKYVRELLTPKEKVRPSNVPENEEKKTADMPQEATSSMKKEMTEEEARQQALHEPMIIDEDSLLCPITQLQFVNPVVAADGQIYERSAIEEWFAKGNKTSPCTGAALQNSELVAFYWLKKIITRGNSEQGYTIAAADLICPLSNRFMSRPALTLRGMLHDVTTTERPFCELLWVRNIRDKLLDRHHFLLTLTQKNSMLLMGICYEKDDEVKQALKWGADPESIEYGRSCLERAAILGNIKIVRMLLDAGAKVTPDLIEKLERCNVKKNKQSVLTILRNFVVVSQDEIKAAAHPQKPKRDEEKISYEQRQEKAVDEIYMRLLGKSIKFFQLQATEKKIFVDKLISLANEEARQSYLQYLVYADRHIIVEILSECEKFADHYATRDLDSLALHLKAMRSRQINSINPQLMCHRASFSIDFSHELKLIFVYELLILNESDSLKIIKSYLNNWSIEKVEEISRLIPEVVAQHNFDDNSKWLANRINAYAKNELKLVKDFREREAREKEISQVMRAARERQAREASNRRVENVMRQLDGLSQQHQEENKASARAVVAPMANEQQATATEILNVKFGTRPFGITQRDRDMTVIFQCNANNKVATCDSLQREYLAYTENTVRVQGETIFNITTTIPSSHLAVYEYEIRQNFLQSLINYQTHLQDPSYRFIKKIFLKSPEDKSEQIRRLITLLTGGESGYRTVTSQLNEAIHRCETLNLATLLRTNRNGVIWGGIKWVSTSFGFFRPTRPEGAAIADQIEALPRQRR